MNVEIVVYQAIDRVAEGREFRAIIYRDGKHLLTCNEAGSAEAARAYAQRFVELENEKARLRAERDEAQQERSRQMREAKRAKKAG